MYIDRKMRKAGNNCVFLYGFVSWNVYGTVFWSRKFFVSLKNTQIEYGKHASFFP